MSDSGPFVRPLDENDLPAALDLIAAQWPEIPRSCQEAMVRHDPWRARQRSFGAFVDHRLVAHARFHHRPVRIGRARLKMIGVCEVVTHPDYRRLGLGHQVLKAAIAWMRQARQHFAVLYTDVPAFYSGVGWGALTEPFCYVPIGAVPKLGPGRHRVTRMPVSETPPALAPIYDRSCGRHPISLLRTPEYWRSWPGWAAGNLWFGLLDDLWTAAWDDDTIVAYGGIQRSLRRAHSVAVVEACSLPQHEEALLDVADDLLARCRHAGGDSVELNLPSDHPIVGKLATAGRRTLNDNAMVRIIDLPTMLAALAPELEARSAALSAPARLRLETSRESATLIAEPGRIAVEDSASGARAALTPSGLGCLLLGYRSAAELASEGQLDASPPSLEALDLLFPPLHSHYWQIDHF